jgi:hypothetical protein
MQKAAGVFFVRVAETKGVLRLAVAAEVSLDLSARWTFSQEGDAGAVQKEGVGYGGGFVNECHLFEICPRQAGKGFFFR